MADLFFTIAVVLYGVGLLVAVPGCLGAFGHNIRLDDAVRSFAIGMLIGGTLSWLTAVVIAVIP